MKKTSILLLACYILLAGSLLPLREASAAAATTAGIDSLNIRSGPGLSYRIVATVKKGTALTVLSESGEWVEVKMPGGETGWAANWLLNRNSQSVAVSSSVDNLRIRKGPGTHYGISGYLSKGQAATILEKSEEWTRISSNTGNGWVSSQFLVLSESTGSKQATTTSPSSNVVMKSINADILNVRTSPSTTGSIAGKLTLGTKVEVLQEKNGWTQIAFSGKKGWVSSEFLSSAGTSQQPSGLASGITGTVTATALSVRNHGSLNGKVIATVNKGQKFTIIEEVNNWAKIQVSPGKYGWVAGWYLKKGVAGNNQTGQQVKDSRAVILYDATNIRQKPSLDSKVIERANKGTEYKVKKLSGSWYELELKGGVSGFVAGWIVEVSGTAPQINKEGGDAYLKNKVIILDPGHGGIDNGTTGVRGTYEKSLTLRTANTLYHKLSAKGAKVMMTRDRDTYLSLASRVGAAHYHGADAFISIHYDSNADRTVKGMTTYYYHSYQKKIAEEIQVSTANATKAKDRGARYGDYHVIRENRQAAALIELGYLSNAEEEMAVLTNHFQNAASDGIVNGLARYFKNK
ncbi:N-acetylmuramoyl-L-alanine amidase [Neobacillus notoginsengisoli]|uniref:N-acetylmuramoyl-L-alanine amidase n=1 Tax=Neobacillus notoginsengisoli TaxID=1578198 RepID=A0A417YTZ0_9BACI|nr:SH3 domain-containing protein [Neobacillus notoginsengisoli]RHW40602.1 N-acetylmuramoyl-L-alanine amidase [Neobacillus notoginsengisoli]